jgi:excisionase family DNA binding protein
MQAVTITQITPPELETLIENSIKKVLSTQQAEQPAETDRWFDLTELCIYHPDKPKKPTVYGWVNAGIIPVHKGGGKKLRFLKSEIDSWLKQGRKRTLEEIASDADRYLTKKNGGQAL